MRDRRSVRPLSCARRPPLQRSSRRSILNVTNGSLCVTWAPPLRVKCETTEQLGDPQRSSPSASAAIVWCSAQTLAPSAAYTVVLSACSEGGCATPQPPLVARTLAAPPSSPTLVARPLPFCTDPLSASAKRIGPSHMDPSGIPKRDSLSYALTRNGTTINS